MKSISEQLGLKGFLDCDHKSFAVFPKDKVATKEPTDNFVISHQCPKIDVYRKFMGLSRVYVPKGDLMAKILERARKRNKK